MKSVALSSKKVMFIILLSCPGFKVPGQPVTDPYPKIGEHVPEFILNNLYYYSTKTTNSKQLMGKPIILDFFSLGCKACFESLPEMNVLKKEFEGRIQFFLIANKHPDMQNQYEKYMRHYYLDMPVEYDDSSLWKQFGIFQVPYTLWIDSAGIIRQITTASAMNRDRLNNLINGNEQFLTNLGENVFARDQELSGFKSYNPDKPFLINGNGGPDTSYLYRSVLSNWKPGSDFSRDLYISSNNITQLNEIGVDLKILYNLAYGDTVMSFRPPLPEEILTKTPNNYGKWSIYPVVESQRKYLFDSDFDSSRNIFSYSLNIPFSMKNAMKLQKIVQNDLKNYFSCDAMVETRKMPYWKITANKKSASILKTKGGDPVWGGTFSSVVFKNQPISSLLLEIWSYHQEDTVFVDETGIKYNIDLNIHCVMTDLKEIKKELQKNGLDLILGEREMKVIVIRDEQ